MNGLLIDIEKYVRQLLPPNRRLPKHIAFATVLFKPLQLLIDEFNELVYSSQLDVGTPGQVAVLEFILQNSVHPNIRILDADGTRVDFRVLIPEGLSQGERAEVIRLVDRSRLRSKRYDVSESINWSSGGSDPVTGLAFITGYPNVTLVGDTYLLQWGIVLSGVYHTKIYNLTNGDVYRDNDIEYTANGSYAHSLPSYGVWAVQVGSITKTVNAFSIEYVTKKPTWINGLALTNDSNTRDATLYLNATVDCKLRVESLDGLPLSGYTHNNAPWDSVGWIEGTTQYAEAPWSELFRLNPTGVGVNGLTPGKSYKFYFVRASNPSPVYTRVIAIPGTSRQYPPQEIDISDDPDLPACDIGPLVGDVILHTQRKWVWNMDASGVFRLRVHAKNVGTGLVVQTKEVQVANIVNGSPVGVFSPSWQPFVNWDTPLPAGSYQLGTEGVSCDSGGISWSSTFTVIEEDTGPVDPGEDPEPQLGDYIARYRVRCWPGDMKLSFSPLPGGNGFYVTDTITTVPSPNYQVSYVINGDFETYRGLGRLVNHIWEFPAELSIRKYRNKIGIPYLSVAGNGEPQNGDMTAFEAFQPHNTSCAQIDLLPIKQTS